MTAKRKIAPSATKFIGAHVRASVVVSQGKGQNNIDWTFYPGRVNRLSAELWSLMLQKPTVKGWIDTGILWEMTRDSAQAAHEGRISIVSPMGERAGRPNRYTPPDMDYPMTEAQAKMEQRLLDADPSPDLYDAGDIDVSEIKGPPIPRAKV